MIEFIEKEYETLKQKTQYAVWSMFKLSCDRQKIPAPSDKTFSLATHQRAVWAVCSQSGRVLGCPWVSLLTDAFSRRILALHICSIRQAIARAR